MPLYIVATPIGNNNDMTTHAIETLKKSEVVIVEEFKEGSKTLKYQNILGKKYEQLNEHSTQEDVQRLVELCKNHMVSLISDCGTPGFCDPGPLLIAACRKAQIEVKPVLGASSLMGLLSMSSQRINQFVFRGFLPAENEARKKELQILTQEKRAIVLMDTPYRLKKILDDMIQYFSKRQMLLALQISHENESYLEGKAQLLKSQAPEKAEFMLLIYPE